MTRGFYANAGKLYAQRDIWSQWVTVSNQVTTAMNNTTWTRWQYEWLGNNTNSTTINVGTGAFQTGELGTYYESNDNWAFRPINVTVQLAWDEWNGAYVETTERRRANDVLRLVDLARRSARHPGRHAETLDVVFQASGLADLTDEECRQIEDGWQRGAEERREDEHQAAMAQLAREERERLQAEADRRAELLLLTLLTHEQKEEWLEHRRVTEVAPSGRVWRLFPKWSGAACLMDGDVRRATLCLHPYDRVPEPDVMAAIIVHLRAGEENDLIKIAILHQGVWTAEEEQIRRGFRTKPVPAAQGGGMVVIPAVA